MCSCSALQKCSSNNSRSLMERLYGLWSSPGHVPPQSRRSRYPLPPLVRSLISPPSPHDAVITHSLFAGSSQININSAGGSPDTPRSFTHLVLWAPHAHIISQGGEPRSHEQQALRVGNATGSRLWRTAYAPIRPVTNDKCLIPLHFGFCILGVALGIVKVRREVICQEIYI